MSVLAHVPFKGRQTDSPPAGTLSKRRAGRGWEPWPQLGLQHTWAISCPPVYTEAGNWTGIQGCNVKADTPPWDTSRDAPEVTVQHCWPPDSVCCSTATPLEDQLYLCPLHACPQLATGLPCRGVVGSPARVWCVNVWRRLLLTVPKAPASSCTNRAFSVCVSWE